MATEPSKLQRILIVEDEDNARKGYEALLRKWNWEILGVGSGEEALAKFQEYQPDLILADVELPGMNGLDLLAQLGEEIARIPVIIITGRGSDERVIQAIEAGAYWYIEKPLKPPVLRALIERALGHALLPAEPVDVGARRHPLGHFRIVRIQHRRIAVELILE